jgi:hypothetical protein
MGVLLGVLGSSVAKSDFNGFFRDDFYKSSLFAFHFSEQSAESLDVARAFLASNASRARGSLPVIIMNLRKSFGLFITMRFSLRYFLKVGISLS